MRISTKGRYPLRMLIELAKRKDDGFISLSEIANSQGISKKYLEQIIQVFNNTDILFTSRGIRGGYKLAKSPDNCTVGDILRLTEGTLTPVGCLNANAEKCPRKDECDAFPVWSGLDKVIKDYLDSITLQDILDGKIQNNI